MDQSVDGMLQEYSLGDFLTVRQLGYAYQPANDVLVDVSVNIPQGAFVTLVGRSGIGKSTLLRILGGLIQPTKGQIHLSADADRERVGIVFQQDNLMPWRTVRENVRLPLELLKGKNGRFPDPEQRVRHMLTLVGLAGAETRYPAQLSGGMAQRVALARALVHEPSLLLLDEPFGALDALTRERMMQELLRIWHAHPVTVFMVTHSIQEAVFLSDSVMVMGRKKAGSAATITHQLRIDLPRPRRLEIMGTAVFHESVTAVRQALELNPS